MATLGIKGHKTRGKEVIQLLEMLGGKSPNNYAAYCDSLCFYIGKGSNIIYYDWVNSCFEDVIIFTLEEFEKLYPYKVGDVVVNHKYGKGDITQMLWIDNEIVYEIHFEDYMAYCKANELCKYDAFKAGDKVIVKGFEKMGEDEIIYVFKSYDGDIKYKTKNHLDTHYFMEDSFTRVEKSYKAETMEVINIDIPKGYEFARIDNGKQQVVFTKKQPQYPKTYKECCEVLCCKADDFFTDFSYNNRDVEISDYEDKIDDLLQNFRKLRYCRDAYWKIASKQMGVDKPWEPDWNNGYVEKYYIYLKQNEIEKSSCFYTCHFLAFPTKEMRDAFCENFKELIEQCKEVL